MAQLLHNGWKGSFYGMQLKVLKVSKYWKQILDFSLELKNERKYFCISALASKKKPKKCLKQKIIAQKD